MKLTRVQLADKWKQIVRKFRAVLLMRGQTVKDAADEHKMWVNDIYKLFNKSRPQDSDLETLAKIAGVSPEDLLN